MIGFGKETMEKKDQASRPKFHVATGVAALTLLSLPSGISAEPMARPGESEGGWRHNVTAYAFLPAQTSGTSTVAGSDVDLDLSLGDIFDNELLDFALAGRYEAWKGDWGIIVDANYVKLGTAINPGPGFDVDADIRQAWLSVMAAYRAVNTTYGENNRRLTFDVQGGVRYNGLKQEFDIKTPGPAATVGGTEYWWEPVVGARVMWEINDKWAGAVDTNFGGFGAGGDDLQVIATAGVSYRAWENTSLRFGYRYYSIDYSTDRSDGTFALDMDQHGPYLGLTVHF
jgi:opacity protein-like surface antigen